MKDGPIFPATRRAGPDLTRLDRISCQGFSKPLDLMRSRRGGIALAVRDESAKWEVWSSPHFVVARCSQTPGMRLSSLLELQKNRLPAPTVGK